MTCDAWLPKVNEEFVKNIPDLTWGLPFFGDAGLLFLSLLLWNWKGKDSINLHITHGSTYHPTYAPPFAPHYDNPGNIDTAFVDSSKMGES